MLQRGSSATGGSTTTSRLFFVMVSTGCQSHSASSTSFVYSSFNHYTELLQSICEIAALQLIPPRPGCDCDHLSGLIYVCGECGRTSAIVRSRLLVLNLLTVSRLLFVLLTQWTHLSPSLKLICSLRPTQCSCL